jgi:hypothetical protein
MMSVDGSTFHGILDQITGTGDPQKVPASKYSELIDQMRLPDLSLLFQKTPAPHQQYLFKQYTWEILDKICDLLLSISDGDDGDDVVGIDDVLPHIGTAMSYIDSASRPREYYMMLVEKLMTTEPLSTSSTCALAQILFTAMATVISKLGDQFIGSGLAIVLKTTVNRYSRQQHEQSKASKSKQKRALAKSLDGADAGGAAPHSYKIFDLALRCFDDVAKASCLGGRGKVSIKMLSDRTHVRCYVRLHDVVFSAFVADAKLSVHIAIYAVLYRRHTRSRVSWLGSYLACHLAASCSSKTLLIARTGRAA